MVVNTSFESCDASRSDTSASQPPLCSSRTKRSRPVWHPNRSLISQRESRWKHRTAQRLKDKSFSLPTSDDDVEQSVVFHSLFSVANSFDSSTKSASPASSAKSQLRAKRKLLPQLPRPSEIIPDIQGGSASDIGLDKLEKEKHVRRVCATSVQLQYIGNNGIQKAVPPFKRSSRGLKKYTPFLVPPKEDQYFQPKRVPRALLSSFFRGSGLASHRPGHRTRFEKKRFHQSRQTKPEYSSAVGDVEFCTDSSHFFTSSAPESEENDIELVSKSTGRRNPAELTRYLPSAPPQESHIDIVSDETGKVTAVESNQEPAAAKAEVESKPNLQGAHKAPGEETEALLLELFDMAQNNPGALLEPEPQTPDPSTPEDKGNPGKLNDGTNQAGSTEEGAENENPQVGEVLTTFEKDIQKGMEFCEDSRKRPWDTAYTFDADLDRRHNIPGLSSNMSRSPGDKVVSPKKSSYGSRILKKMGFKGRLGREEDGIAEPIRIKKPRTGRPGIGLQSMEVVGVDLEDTTSPKTNGYISQALPVSFKGDKEVKKESDEKAQETGLGTDIFNRRKVSVHRAREKAASNNPGTNAIGAKGKDSKPSVVLDDDDEYETEREDSEFDNRRRAIILDVDVLIKNSYARRLAAFKSLVKSSSIMSNSFNVEKMMHTEVRDMSDSDCIMKILHETGADTSNSPIDVLLDELDAAYKKVEAPVLNSDVINLLQAYNRDVYFGLFHSGTRGRLSYELEHMNLANCFLQGPRSCVKDGDDWPYLETRQELLCRVGLRARQSLFLVKESLYGEVVLGGCVAGAIMGAGVMMASSGREEIMLRVIGLENGLDGARFSLPKALSDREVFITKFVKSWAKLPKRRRVLGLYSADGLWYSGVEKYGESHTSGPKQGYSLVQFHNYENSEWIKNDNVIPLIRKDFRRLRNAEFVGLLSPEDIDDLL